MLQQLRGGAHIGWDSSDGQRRGGVKREGASQPSIPKSSVNFLTFSRSSVLTVGRVVDRERNMSDCRGKIHTLQIQDSVSRLSYFNTMNNGPKSLARLPHSVNNPAKNAPNPKLDCLNPLNLYSTCADVCSTSDINLMAILI